MCDAQLPRRCVALRRPARASSVGAGLVMTSRPDSPRPRQRTAPGTIRPTPMFVTCASSRPASPTRLGSSRPASRPGPTSSTPTPRWWPGLSTSAGRSTSNSPTTAGAGRPRDAHPRVPSILGPSGPPRGPSRRRGVGGHPGLASEPGYPPAAGAEHRDLASAIADVPTARRRSRTSRYAHTGGPEPRAAAGEPPVGTTTSACH